MAIDMYAIFLSFLCHQVKIFVGIIKKLVLSLLAASRTKQDQIKENMRFVGNKIQNLFKQISV